MGKKSTDEEIMESEGETLRLLNQKTGHKNACIHHKKNGEPYLNPVRALERQDVHLRINRANLDCLMSEFLRREEGKTLEMTICQNHSN